MNNRFSLDEAFKLARTNKKLNANYQRVRQALGQLTDATCNAPSLTDEQKIALEKAILALQYMS